MKSCYDYTEFISMKGASIDVLALSEDERKEFYKEEGFGEYQIREIELGIKDGLNVNVYATREFTSTQMEQIRLGLIDDVDITAYAFQYLSYSKMEEIRKRTIKAKINNFKNILSKSLINIGYSEEQINQVLLGYDNNIDYTYYLDRKYTAAQMERIRLCLVNNKYS